MDEKLKKLITKNKKSLVDWTNAINNHIENKNRDISTEESIEDVYELVEVFSDITDIIISYGRYKDEFEYEKFSLGYNGPELIINSIKTKSTFYIGLGYEGIYLTTHLRNNFNIRNMDDKFWIDLLSLYNYGNFELEQTEGFDSNFKKEFPEIFNIKKSIIFNIFRKFFVDTILEKDNYRKYDKVGDFGVFKVFWDETFSLDKIIDELTAVFKIMYSLNYKLWKIEDLQNNKIKD